jgi:PGF-CTERM protein
LETTVEETGADEVTLEAQTESFPLFAVAEIEETSTANETETTNETETEDEPTDEETTDGIPGFGPVLAVAALIAAAMLARRRAD